MSAARRERGLRARDHYLQMAAWHLSPCGVAEIYRDDSSSTPGQELHATADRYS